MVGFCVVLVDVDILGLMWVWGLSIDSIAVINLVLAIGRGLGLTNPPSPYKGTEPPPAAASRGRIALERG